MVPILLFICLHPLTCSKLFLILLTVHWLSYPRSAPNIFSPSCLATKICWTTPDSVFSAIFSITIKFNKKETLPNISRHFTLNVLLGRRDCSTNRGLPKQMQSKGNNSKKTGFFSWPDFWTNTQINLFFFFSRRSVTFEIKSGFVGLQGGK